MNPSLGSSRHNIYSLDKSLRLKDGLGKGLGLGAGLGRGLGLGLGRGIGLGLGLGRGRPKIRKTKAKYFGMPVCTAIKEMTNRQLT